MWNFAILNYSNEIQKIFPWCSQRSFTLHIPPLTYLLLPSNVYTFQLLYVTLTCFIHHLPAPCCMLTANVSFESCVLLNGQKVDREPYNYMELTFPWTCLKQRRNNICHYKIILAKSVIQNAQFQLQEQTTYFRSSMAKLRIIRSCSEMEI